MTDQNIEITPKGTVAMLAAHFRVLAERAKTGDKEAQREMRSWFRIAYQ